MIKDDLQFTLTKYKCMAALNIELISPNIGFFSKTN